MAISFNIFQWSNDYGSGFESSPQLLRKVYRVAVEACISCYFSLACLCLRYTYFQVTIIPTTYAVIVLLQIYRKMAAKEADISLKSILKSKRLKSGQLAPYIIKILIVYQLYKPYGDVTTVRLKPKRKKIWHGKCAGRRVRERRERLVLYIGNHSIPVIRIVRNDSGTKKSKNKHYETCLVTISSSEPIPTLKPYYSNEASNNSENPHPVLERATLIAETNFPSLILCNSRSLRNKVDELEIVLRINLTSLAVITECWDITTETGAIKGYLNFFSTRRDRDDTRCGGGKEIYCHEDLPCRKLNNLSDSRHETIKQSYRPRGLPRIYSCIILAVVYYP